MSTEDIYVTIGSLLVVAALTGLALALGLRKSARIADLAALEAIVAGADPDARIEQYALDAAGRAAVALLDGRRLAAARVVGEDVSIRIAATAKSRVRLSPSRAVLSFADLGFPPLSLRFAAGSEAPAWLADLAKEQ